jgi:hypothetical protein
MTVSAREWTELFANRLGIAPPSEEEQGRLLELAGTAAHASERTAAPISCWLAARAGIDPGEACDAAKGLAGELGAGG